MLRLTATSGITPMPRSAATDSTYEKGLAADDFDTAAALVGEAVGLIDEVRPAADIVRDVARDAAGILGRAARSVQG
jgi:nitronate monooxygenase